MSFFIHTQNSFSQGGLSEQIFNNSFIGAEEIVLNPNYNLPSNHTMEKYLPYTHGQRFGNCVGVVLANCRTILYARDNELIDKHKISLESFSPYYSYFTLVNTGHKLFEISNSSIWDDSDIITLDNCADKSEGADLSLEIINKVGFYKIKNFEYPNLYPFTDSLPKYVPDLEKYYQYGKKYAFDSVFIVNTEINEHQTERLRKLEQITIDSNNRLEVINLWREPNSNDANDNTLDKIKYMISKDIPGFVALFPFHAKLSNAGRNKEAIFYQDNEIECISSSCDTLTKNLEGLCKGCNKRYFNGEEIYFPLDFSLPSFSAHAVTLIGYNDTLNNGSFLILNSWGENWGEKGMMWIPYDYLLDYCRKLLFFNTNSNINEEQEKISLNIDKVNVIPRLFQDELNVTDLDFNWQANFSILNLLGNFDSDFLYKDKKKFVGDNSVEFIGNWINGKPIDGKLIFPSKKNISANWEGEFKKPIEYYSTYFDEGYCLYEGEFLNDEFHGKGIYYYSDGLIAFEGDFINGKINGFGIDYDKFSWNKTGKYYEGQFLNGQWHGRGILYFSESGKINYEGNFSNNQFNGYGVLYKESGDIEYQGEFLDGVPK